MNFQRLIAIGCVLLCPCAPIMAQGDDSCSSAQLITGLGTFSFDNSLATTDGLGDPLCDVFGTDQIDLDVWFSWTAPSSGDFRAETCGLTSVDTRMQIVDGACGGTVLACDDDSCNLQSRVSWSAVGAQTYLIRIGSFPSSPGGSGTFTISAATPPPDLLYRFSIDTQGPTISMPDSTFFEAITGGDLLGPASGTPALGPLLTPGIAVKGGLSGLNLFMHDACVGVPPGAGCPVELDALSYGTDERLGTVPITCGLIRFSVDEFAMGLPDAYVPSLSSESAALVVEASADIFTPETLPAPPIGLFLGQNVGSIDGDGLASSSGAAYPGLGLIEPNAPGIGSDPGDNLDALVIAESDTYPIWYSLDAAYLDVLEGAPLNGTAALNGFLPGDVVMTTFPGAVPTLYATAAALGLGPDDDLDALALAESGDMVFTPSDTPNDWLTQKHTDMLLFSVRRGSAIIGSPDSILNLPISEGDILTTPKVGGFSANPGIYITAESLGLMTLRSGQPQNDDANAFATIPKGRATIDCNGNGCADSLDIKSGKSLDKNGNGVPDECDRVVGLGYCTGNGGGPSCPCGNNGGALEGCLNSTGQGGHMSGSGSVSVALDDLVLTASGLPHNQFGLIFMGSNQIDVPFGDGKRCVGGTTNRFGVQSTGAAGLLTIGPGIVATSQGFPLSTRIDAGETWNFQAWYRDPAGPCHQAHNLSDALSITFAP